jgi:hypothetical protein
MSHLRKLAAENLHVVDALLPDHVKMAASNHQNHLIAQARFGISDFTLAKVAEYFGGRIAARHMKWRPVREGLEALRNLRG